MFLLVGKMFCSSFLLRKIKSRSFVTLQKLYSTPTLLTPAGQLSRSSGGLWASSGLFSESIICAPYEVVAPFSKGKQQIENSLTPFSARQELISL